MSERLGVLKVRGVSNPQRFEVWKYEEFQSPKDSESLNTKSLQTPKSWSLKVRRVSTSERLGVSKYEESATPKESKSEVRRV